MVDRQSTVRKNNQSINGIAWFVQKVESQKKTIFYKIIMIMM